MTEAKSRPISLTLRVMLFVALATSLCLVMVGAVVQTSIERHFAEQDAAELQVVADAVAGVLQLGNDLEAAQLTSALNEAVAGHHGVYFTVADQNGHLLYATSGPDLAKVASGVSPVQGKVLDGLQIWQEGGNTYRGAVLELVSETQTFTLTTAADIEFHLHFLHSFGQTLAIILAGAVALTLLAAWFGVHQGHAPLRKLSADMRTIQSDRLHVRLDPATVPVELQDLVVSFNQMIARLEEGFVRLANFSADIAHELRTPLTNLITQTQVGLGKARQQDEYRELLYSNLEEQERLAQMVAEMLWLAQTEHGLVKPEFVTLDLAAQVHDQFEYLGDWAEERQVHLLLEGETRRVQGDRGMLRRALSNLLSNAIRHTPPGGEVSVRLASLQGARVSLAIQNTGTEIPPEHLSRIFDRFYRIDPSRQRHSEGVGLGLAIVRSIIDIHGGKISVSSEGGLTTFTITLPAIVGQ